MRTTRFISIFSSAIVALALWSAAPAAAQNIGGAINNSAGASSATPAGPAGGDLGGTYPNPTVQQVQGAAFGTGVVAALHTAIGTAGAPVVLNGAGGTPSSLVLTNATNLPLSSVTGLGTGVATALGIAVGTAGAPVILNGAGGTPSSLVLTNATGLPLGSVTGLGTGVATALGVAVGTAGSVITNGGALGTPSSGSGANLTSLNATNISTGTLANARLTGAGVATVAGQSCALGSTCGLSTANNTIAGNITLNNTTTFFTGPSMAQGTTGTWWACGTVEVDDTSAAATFSVQLTDGTTVLSQLTTQTPGTSVVATVALCGILANPAGNIRLNVKDSTSTNGLIISNSNIWGMRIQ